ncbi:MAG: alpha-ketoacid dehydrogenase subunit beta [Desulfobaccales bacterium]|nr:alpha-ketoacid dehydrogenase subunit beta [Desulfobaccales bacterium]
MPWTKVFLSEDDLQQFKAAENLRSLSYVEALREAQEQLLESDPRVFILGEGVDDPGGIFGSTLGLVEKFGPGRVIDIPIAENGLTGVAVGAAAAGMRPIFVHMRMDFLPMCMDQIVNHAAKWYYMSGGRVPIPLVIRSIIGRGWGSAAQHSQALHALFMHIPGLKIAMPSTPYDAKGLLIAAVEDGNPVMFIEHRWIYNSVGYVPEEKYTVPFGQGVVRKEGREVTVVALSQMVYEAAKAARELEAEGISVEVIDPRTLNPLDDELICNSVKKTGRLVIADVACKTGGVGGEIACRVVEKAPGWLKAPVKRINFADTPTPSSPVLEEAYYPTSLTIKETIKELLRR